MVKNKPLFVIHKMSRPPNFESGSYAGPTWDTAKIRHEYKPFYSDEEKANELADKLGQFNAVGFEVSPVAESCAVCDSEEDTAELMLTDYPALKRGEDGDLKVECLAYKCSKCGEMYMHSSSESIVDTAVENHNKVYSD